jgi:cell wall-associated NlpC family hydrolase
LCRIACVSLLLLTAALAWAAPQKKAPARANQPVSTAPKPASAHAKKPVAAARQAAPAKKSSKPAAARYRKARRTAKPKPVDPAIAALPPFPEFLGAVIPPRLPPPGVPGNYTASVSRLLGNAYSLIGIRYRRGGSTPATGFDCSGFVRYVFQSTFPIGLSPASREQYKVGAPVEKEQLEAGDLVFFRSRARGWHVGIYVGDGEFIHSPRRNRTVTVSSMSKTYWRRYYVGARRIPLPEIADAAGNNNN